MKQKLRLYIITIIVIAVTFGVFAIATNILNDSDEQEVVEAYNTEASPLPVSVRELLKVLEVQRTEPAMKEIKIGEGEPIENEDDIKPEPPEPVNDTKLYCWKEFRKAGFSEEATAGIMGNIEEEHHFLTDGDGLCQWTGNRKAAMQQHCARMGVSSTSVEGQVSYAIQELLGSNQPVGKYLDNRSPSKANGTFRDTIKHGYELLGESYKDPHEYSSLDEFKSTTSVDDACLSVMGRFERCNSGYRVKDGLWYARSNERLHSSRVLYSTYKGTTI